MVFFVWFLFKLLEPLYCFYSYWSLRQNNLCVIVVGMYVVLSIIATPLKTEQVKFYFGTEN